MDKSAIPSGVYCYDSSGKCPYWSIDLNKPDQEGGYCEYIGKGDWESDNISLLWDSIKECGINID